MSESEVPDDYCERGCERMRPGDIECPDCGAEAQPEEED